MDICIFYDNGKVETVDNVCTIESLRGGRELLILYKDSDNESNVFTVQLADIAMLKIYGG